MFQSLSKVGPLANILKKTVSGDDYKYSDLSKTQNVLNQNPFLSDILAVPGLTRLNQIVTGIIGVFLGVCLTFLMGTILVQLLFYKLFAVYDEASATRKLVAFIIFGLCIFCGLLCVFLYGTDWTENAKSIIVIRQENYTTQTKSKLGKAGVQWKVLWTFLIGISIFFLIIYSCAEIITTGLFQCKCFSFLWYRRPTCNYVYFMACALFSSVIISSSFTIFISIQKDSNVSIDSLIGDSNPSYISLSNMLYGMLMLKQLYLVIPFGVVFGPILALVFQYNYLKDWVDYQNIRNENTHNGKSVLIKTTSLDLSDDDEDDSPIDITKITPENGDAFFDQSIEHQSTPTHKQISFKSRQQNTTTVIPGNSSVSPQQHNFSTPSTTTVIVSGSSNPLAATTTPTTPVQVHVEVEQETTNPLNPLQTTATGSSVVVTEKDDIVFDNEDL